MTQSRTFTKLYGLGSNGEGQLGVNHQTDLSEPKVCYFRMLSASKTQQDVPLLDHLPNNDSIKKMVAGGNHTLVLTHNGVLYASGVNTDGRCGSAEETDSYLVFTSVDWAKGRRITDIAATWEASFFVEDAQAVWTCGGGSRGELGVGKDVVKCIDPQMVLDTEQISVKETKILSISSAMSHTVLLLSNGDVYGWGGSRRGQLGEKLRSKKVVWEPQKMDLSFKASSVTSGRDFTLLWNTHNHALLGEISPLDTSMQLYFATLMSQHVAGWSTIYGLRNGRVLAYGKGQRGQLPPANLPHVNILAAGSEHCIALLDTNQVVAWGWGEHGNCGLPTDDRGNVVDRWNQISVPLAQGDKISGIGAGCATSFIWTIH